jgi:muconate cycloisomerase
VSYSWQGQIQTFTPVIGVNPIFFEPLNLSILNTEIAQYLTNTNGTTVGKVVIEKIEATIVDLPTIRPHHLSMTVMKKQTMVIIRLWCSDGTEGIGEATTIGGLSYGEESPESMKLNIDTYFTPLLLGKNATNINAAMKLLDKHIKGNRIVKSGIETALLDAQGKRLGVSVATLLGGAISESLPVLWTLASGNTEKDIEEAEMYLANGRHNVFKLKVGWQPPSVAIAHVTAIKRALGNRAKVTVDVNQAWDESTAKNCLAALQDAGVDLVEQPIVKENIEGLARLTQMFRVPIMADESQSDLQESFKLAKIRAADVWALKIGKAGGLYNVLKAAAIAEASDISLYGGTLLEGTIGSVASAHAFSTIRNMAWGTELFGPLLLTDDIVKNRVEFSNASMRLPQGAGLGLELDLDKLNFYKRK